MGEVYLARDTELDRKVALKVLSPRLALDEAEQRRLKAEARLISALNHPNIVTVFDVGRIDGVLFVAMEFVEGRTLRQMLSANRLSPREILSIAVQFVGALAAADRAGIVHRDLKPENIMLRPDGWVKVLDFGLAKSTRPRTAPPSAVTHVETAPYLVVGTVPYMSPEQVRGQVIDPRTDVWSAGVVLYEMLTNRIPFQGESSVDLMVSILTDAPPPIDESPDVPERLAAIVSKALAKSRDERYDAPEALLADLRAVERDLVAGGNAGPSSTGDAFVREVLGEPAREARGSLPDDPLPLLGRDAEVETLLSLLAGPDTRLVTLTGPGGTGKTRLALELARLLGPRFRHGVYFVDLAPVSEAPSAVAAFATALGLVSKGGPLLPEITEFLSKREALLLLDNFEQVLDAATLVPTLLAAAPRVKVLATSRERLRLKAEREFPVGPLPVADPARVRERETLLASPAVALFVRRARAADPAFTLTPENAPVVASICARLDGLPLAIELAAARIRLLPPAALLTRLEGSLAILTGGARDMPTRQQTMRGAIEWGHQLLAPEERTLFRRVAVFSGGFTLEAAEAVGADDAVPDLFGTLAALVEKSLVRRTDRADGAPGASRFGLLQVLREYALERLAESGEAEATRARHFAYFRDEVTAAAQELEASPRPAVLDRLDVDRENVRAALAFATGAGDARVVLRLAASLFWFWYLRGHYAEGRELLERALARSAPDDPERVRALLGAGALAHLQCDYAAAESRLLSCLEAAERLGDDLTRASALGFLASVLREKGDLDGAGARLAESEALFRARGDERGAARARNSAAFSAWLKGNVAAARVAAREVLPVFRRLDDPEGIAWALLNLAAGEVTDIPAAARLAKEALVVSRGAGYREGIAWSLDLLGTIERRAGNMTRARALLQKSLEHHWRLGDRWRAASAFDGLAEVAAAEGRFAQAARLLGASNAIRKAIGAPVPPVEQSARRDAEREAESTLGPAVYADALAAGERLGLDDAAAEALGWASGSRP